MSGSADIQLALVAFSRLRMTDFCYGFRLKSTLECKETIVHLIVCMKHVSSRDLPVVGT
jgi:hypothetical protein